MSIQHRQKILSVHSRVTLLAFQMTQLVVHHPNLDYLFQFFFGSLQKNTTQLMLSLRNKNLARVYGVTLTSCMPLALSKSSLGRVKKKVVSTMQADPRKKQQALPFVPSQCQRKQPKILSAQDIHPDHHLLPFEKLVSVKNSKSGLFGSWKGVLSSNKKT